MVRAPHGPQPASVRAMEHKMWRMGLHTGYQPTLADISHLDMAPIIETMIARTPE